LHAAPVPHMERKHCRATDKNAYQARTQSHHLEIHTFLTRQSSPRS
jgi:hypothetical protein